jgi:nucleoid-associated protein YgaU
VTTRDLRAHTAKNLEFEPESARADVAPEPQQPGRRAALGDTSGRSSRSPLATGRVEPTSHVVQTGESFWTISRLYYNSGRYYRALWKANTSVCPKIDRLRVNDTVVVPAVEDLDPEYIDPPQTPAPSSLGTARRSGTRAQGSSDGDAQDRAESPESAPDSSSGEPISTSRTNRITAGGVPVRRSSRTDLDVNSPPPEADSDGDSSANRTARLVHRPRDDDDDLNSDEPRARSAARPRASTSGTGRQPVYKIRAFNTLRSIARDMLGDSHRSDEILELNRDVIDDPAHLTVGQVIKLPEDARTSVRRSADH